MDIKDKIEMKQVEELTPYVNNPKEHPPEQIEKIASSIKEFGFTVPVVIDGDNTIIMGHGRIQASKKLDLDEVPVIVRDDLTEAQVKALRIADNKVAESGWEDESLEAELESLDEFDFNMELTGFDEDEIVDILDPGLEEVEEEPVPEEPEDPTTNKGDLWILGDHRLLCGDATDEDDVERLMDGEKAEMLFTDPPYLMNFTGSVHADGSKSHNSNHGSIKNDKMSREDGDKFVSNIIQKTKKYVVGAYYIFFYRLGIDYVFRALDKHDLDYRALIIWDKGNHTLSNSDYMSKYEPIVYGWVNEHNFYGSDSNFDIWEIERTTKNDLHPTMKPLELGEKGILNSSKKENIVLDLFGGSGSTLVVSEQLNRKCYTMELDPHYCDVIVERWENLTGREAERVTNE